MKVTAPQVSLMTLGLEITDHTGHKVSPISFEALATYLNERLQYLDKEKYLKCVKSNTHSCDPLKETVGEAEGRKIINDAIKYITIRQVLVRYFEEELRPYDNEKYKKITSNQIYPFSNELIEESLQWEKENAAYYFLEEWVKNHQPDVYKQYKKGELDQEEKTFYEASIQYFRNRERILQHEDWSNAQESRKIEHLAQILINLIMPIAIFLIIKNTVYKTDPYYNGLLVIGFAAMATGVVFWIWEIGKIVISRLQ